jgi:hypothetical protein
MKTIFYILSIVVIGAAGYFALDNSKKIQAQIDLFAATQGTKRSVEANITKTEKDLEDTTAALDEAKTNFNNLTASLDNEKAKESAHRKAIEKYEAETEDLNIKLAKLAEIEEQIKAKIGNIPWDQIPPEIERLQQERKEKSTRLDGLNTIIAKLTEDIASKRAEHGRQVGDLAEIRRRIGLNSVVGAITFVDSTWGFVVVNLGSNNSNITTDSELLVTRAGRYLGRLEPNSVEANQSICDLEARSLTPGVRIQPGDKVTIADSAGAR